jgi:hypothetical protein
MSPRADDTQRVCLHHSGVDARLKAIDNKVSWLIGLVTTAIGGVVASMLHGCLR